MVRHRVDLSEVEHLFLKKIPKPIVERIFLWVRRVEMNGLLETRKIIGLHDEPLKGDRAGQRSIRLNLAYRLFYIELPEDVIVVKVIEVNKHDH
ncbi:MAG: hypothetical protein H7336_16550 [Bacteriovorax sp.]|nr:hypothetical protein [Bacteriovorax sp.]